MTAAYATVASWLPLFACPECAGELVVDGDVRICGACGRRYERRDNLWRFLSNERAAAAAPFLRQYRAVRDRDGSRGMSAEERRRLPDVAGDHPRAAEWRVRQESYRHFLDGVIAPFRRRLRVLDLGAGNGWLAHRLALLGHGVTAIDQLADDADGLGALQLYPASVVAVQASFDAPPFAAAQFDVVVFNGSLHYAADVAATLGTAWRMRARGGVVAVIDSPMFTSATDGEAMLADLHRRFEDTCGIGDVERFGTGYLTFEALRAVARQCGADTRFIRSHGPMAWRVRRAVARVRLGRAPARFGVWVAR